MTPWPTSNGKAICPLHVWDFDLRTGISPFNPAATTMITDFCRITGRHRVADLCRADLATLRPDVARRTDLEYML